MREELRAANRSIQSARELAFEQIATRLRAAYRAEIAVLEQELLAAIGAARSSAYLLALGKLRARFEEYAEQRGPSLVRRTALVGFPDPDPTSRRTSTSKVTQRRWEEAAELRQRLATLEREFLQSTNGLFADVEASAGAERAAIARTIMERVRQADQRANEVASKEVARQGQAAFIASRTEFRLPPVAGVSQVIPGGGSPPEAPEVEPTFGVQDEALIRHDLEIWLRTHGYRLADAGRGVRDATQEFIRWRRETQDGR